MPDGPFALKLDYLTDFTKQQIVDRTIVEIKKQGFRNKSKLDLWHEQMLNIFINVDLGVSITGVYKSDGNAVFYSGERVLGYIEDKELARLFFDIWLSSKTSEPNLRRKLLGIK